MRISGGSAKGRRTATKKLFVKAASGGRLRPTSAKVREALFDILGGRIEGSAFVDLYAGTGTVGFESLSRGAAKAVFIEHDPIMTDTIKRNAIDFGFSRSVQIFQGRACDFLARALAAHEQYDMFFLDPPYQSEEIERVLPVLGGGGMLKEGAAVIVEHFFKKYIPEQVGILTLHKRYRYGDTMLSLYKKGI